MEAPASLRPALSHCLFPDHYPCNYPSPHPADFLRALSAAIFINVHEDVEALQNWHGAGGPGTMTPAQLAAQGPAYYNRRVRRMVREPEPLKASLQQLLDDWRGVCDPTTGYLLLSPDRPGAPGSDRDKPWGKRQIYYCFSPTLKQNKA